MWGGVTITKGDNKLNADLILNIYKIKIEEGENTKKTKIFFLKCKFFLMERFFGSEQRQVSIQCDVQGIHTESLLLFI